jgi:hypothetical protein
VPPTSSPFRGRPGQTAAIGDPTFLSDCRGAAAVTRDGVADWRPSPRLDSPSAFDGAAQAGSTCRPRPDRALGETP